jgi:hypothetical protein
MSMPQQTADGSVRLHTHEIHCAGFLLLVLRKLGEPVPGRSVDVS